MSLVWTGGAGCVEAPEQAVTAPAAIEEEDAENVVGPDVAEEEPDSPAPPEDTSEPTPDLDEEEAYAALWTPGTPLRIRLELDDEDRAALDADPRTYVCGRFTLENGPWGAITLPHVGVRLKGSQTFDTLDGKPSLKIDFDACVAEQRFATLEHLTLNNMASDPVMGREVLAYGLLHDAGQPAPRAAFAEVWIGEVPYGLYAALEGMDKRWLKRRYADPNGDLWEADDDAELSSLGIVNFSLASGVGDEAALAHAAEVVEGAVTDVWAPLDEVIAMDAFLEYHAWTTALGAKDGYPYNLNDYFLYADPADGGRLRFSPWGLDETWPGYAAFDGGEPGSVGARCFGDPECLDRLAERTLRVLNVYDALDPVTRAEAIFAETGAAVAEEARRPGGGGPVETARRDFLDELAGWSERLRRDLP